jgi:hypothetical protein
MRRLKYLSTSPTSRWYSFLTHLAFDFYKFWKSHRLLRGRYSGLDTCRLLDVFISERVRMVWTRHCFFTIFSQVLFHFKKPSTSQGASNLVHYYSV